MASTKSHTHFWLAAARGVKVIGISANGLEDHAKWVCDHCSIGTLEHALIGRPQVKDIEEWGGKVAPTEVAFPIVSHRVIMNLLFSS